MGYEVDYLPVGDSESQQTGDAIAMRFWNPERTEQIVITIDGGTLESGAEVASHIKKYYRTDVVDFAFLTHPDADHSSGLREIIKGLKVQKLVLLVPWQYSAEILSQVRQADGRATADSIEAKLRAAYPALEEILELAEEQGIEIIEPFLELKAYTLGAGTSIYILGPSREEYLGTWLPGYDALPQTAAEVIRRAVSQVLKAATKVIQRVREYWDQELLTDPSDGDVNCENNSSLIFVLEHDGRRFFFCGDAGVPAIASAVNRGHGIGVAVNSFGFFDVPHHGSRRNLGPTLLNALFGMPRSSTDTSKDGTAFISAPPNDPKHPSRRIANALTRRGRKVVCTDENARCHHSDDYVQREGWNPVDPLPFYDQVEDVD